VHGLTRTTTLTGVAVTLIIPAAAAALRDVIHHHNYHSPVMYTAQLIKMLATLSSRQSRPASYPHPAYRPAAATLFTANGLRSAHKNTAHYRY